MASGNRDLDAGRHHAGCALQQARHVEEGRRGADLAEVHARGEGEEEVDVLLPLRFSLHRDAVAWAAGLGVLLPRGRYEVSTIHFSGVSWGTGCLHGVGEACVEHPGGVRDRKGLPTEGIDFVLVRLVALSPK